MHHFLLHELITLRSLTTIEQARIKSFNHVLAIYHDENHSHLIIEGQLHIPMKTSEFVLISHRMCDAKWCLRRMEQQPRYHQNKTHTQELEELFDFLEIPFEQTLWLMEKLKRNGQHLITSVS